MHKTLLRQIKRHLGSIDALKEELLEFMNVISETYKHADDDRRLLERSMELSSKELSEINEQLKEEIETVKNSKEENHELNRMNKFMIGRELKMVELKKENEQMKAQLKEKQATEQTH